MTEQPFAEHTQRLRRLAENLARVIEGKADRIDILVVAFAAGGSVLIEDVPGVGKTTLAKALARSLDAIFHRIQFTPDLLPTDVLGASVYNPINGTFTFHEGPIFCNVLLADEINRASPRTQSALLEAMNECQATIEGQRYPLPSPFVVLATQNPIEFHGTYPLPEAQLDRFLIRLRVGYPEAETEVSILRSQSERHPLEELSPVLTTDEAVGIQNAVRRVRVDDSVGRYIVDLSCATRADSRLKLGVSPRGSLMLYRAAQACALLGGRDFVMPDDVQTLAPHVLSHRLTLTPKAKYSGVQAEEVIREVIKTTRVPT